jgi:hypothetical protein
MNEAHSKLALAETKSGLFTCCEFEIGKVFEQMVYLSVMMWLWRRRRNKYIGGEICEERFE